MSQTWICQGPSGVYGEGIVGDGWTSCIHNHFPTLPKQCQDTYPTLQEARENCQKKLLNVMDLGPFQPNQYSCVIDKSNSQCQGKYRTQFLKQSNPPSYYSEMGNTYSMETHFMDIPYFYKEYLEKINQEQQKSQEIEDKRIKQKQFEEQEQILQTKIQEEKKQKEKLYRERIEQEIKDEIKKEIYLTIGDTENLKQKLKQAMETERLKQAMETERLKQAMETERLKQQEEQQQEQQQMIMGRKDDGKTMIFDPKIITEVNEQIQSLKAQLNESENEELLKLNKKIQKMQNKELSQKQEYLLMKQALDTIINPPPQETNIPRFFDSMEQWLLSVLESDKRYEPFSYKPTNFPVFLLIIGLLLLFLSFCKLK